MAGWSGFTDEDLHRLKKQSETQLFQKQKRQPAKEQRNIVNEQEKIVRPPKPQQNKRKMPVKREEMQANNDLEALQSKHLEKIQIDNGRLKEGDVDKSKTLNGIENENSSKPNLEEKLKTGLQISVNSINPKDKDGPNLKLISDEDAAEVQMSELEKLQKRQKEIEEQNKIKKKIINETINERYKKAQHEASTLQNVQKELTKLDCLLAKDVEILRTKIEEATIAYCTAQKRYDKAEKEFVNAKLDLKLKSDTKEELTQHLFTIIQENELRKSKKLEELMSKLNLSENKTHCYNANDDSQTVVGSS